MQYLKNRLKIKSQSVPQGKLSRGSSRDQSPALWSPCQREDGTLHLVRGRLYELRCDGVARVLYIRRWWQHIRNVNAFRLKGTTVSPITLPDASL